MNKACWEKQLAEIKARMAYANWSSKSLDQVVERMGETMPTLVEVDARDARLIFSTEHYYMRVTFHMKEASVSWFLVEERGLIFGGTQAGAYFWEKFDMTLVAMRSERDVSCPQDSR